MKAIAAMAELRRGKRITSEMIYGCFYMLSGNPNVIYYACSDSGCNACKNEYTIEEFLSLDYKFEVLDQLYIDEI